MNPTRRHPPSGASLQAHRATGETSSFYLTRPHSCPPFGHQFTHHSVPYLTPTMVFDTCGGVPSDDPPGQIFLASQTFYTNRAGTQIKNTPALVVYLQQLRHSLSANVVLSYCPTLPHSPSSLCPKAAESSASWSARTSL